MGLALGVGMGLRAICSVATFAGRTGDRDTRGRNVGPHPTRQHPVGAHRPEAGGGAEPVMLQSLGVSSYPQAGKSN